MAESKCPCTARKLATSSLCCFVKNSTQAHCTSTWPPNLKRRWKSRETAVLRQISPLALLAEGWKGKGGSETFLVCVVVNWSIYLGVLPEVVNQYSILWKLLKRETGSWNLSWIQLFPQFQHACLDQCGTICQTMQLVRLSFKLFSSCDRQQVWAKRVSKYLYLYQPLKSQMPHFEQLSSFYIDTGESDRFCYDSRIYVDLLEYMSNK